MARHLLQLAIRAQQEVAHDGQVPTRSCEPYGFILPNMCIGTFLQEHLHCLQVAKLCSTPVTQYRQGKSKYRIDAGFFTASKLRP
jgi:hypothetical protein